MANPVGDFEVLSDIIDEYENAEVNDDTPAPKWVLDMMEDLRSDIRKSIDLYSSFDFERAV